ncbi:MAG: hypothetical protein ACOCRX_09915 [Candidatus Woesearchaeota archaeon]
MKDKLTKNEVLWIFALKDGNEREHYKRYYNDFYKPTEEILYSITKEIVSKLDEWTFLIHLLESNKSMQRFMLNEGVIGEYSIEPNLEQWLFYGIKIWAIHVRVKDLTKWCGGDHWIEWAKEERATYNE